MVVAVSDEDPKSIRIRMYNVGFGDCFLISFPGADRPRTMLVDCGQHSASDKPFDLEDDVVTTLLRDVTDRHAGPRIDVVVLSHRHQDHVKGFEDPRWDGVEVGEVWMPWTENPNDPVARSLLERQSGAALRLSSLVGAGNPAQLVALNSLTNEKAMATLHAGFSGSPLRRFLPEPLSDEPGTKSSEFAVVHSDLLPGVTVRLLGPSRDEAVIRRMDPPETERFLGEPGGDVISTGTPLPFAAWRVDQRAFKETPENEHLDLRNLGEIVKAGREDPYLLSVAVEQTVNNTSLMLLIQLGRASLLFPGDSQWGSWDRVLRSEEGRELLSRTTFYKVGHHGSHNATPRTFVETHLRDAVGMVSVAGTSIPSWVNIPKADLLDALRVPGRVAALAISNGQGGAPASASTEGDGLVVEMKVPV
jgi:beta-lactamase superfamily II metal-dependent hydrolase